MSEEPETPVDAPEQPEPEDGESQGDENQERPEDILEPHLGFGEFCAVAQVSGPAQAALKQWMRLQRYNSAGHYPLAQWQEYLKEMLAYTG